MNPSFPPPLPIIGPPDARIAIVLDFPSEQDRLAKRPLSDYAGKQFLSILSRVGLHVTSCAILTFLSSAPPDEDLSKVISTRKTCPGPGWEFMGDAWVAPAVAEARARLIQALDAMKPALVITLGPAALWAFTSETNTLAWRGSRLTPPDHPFTILPTLAPRLAIPQPENLHTIRADLTRAKNIFEGTQLPRNYNFIIEPSFKEAFSYLNFQLHCADRGPLKLSGDLETRNYHIACFGIAPDADSAICIPSLRAEGDNPFYWTLEEEAELVESILKLFQHPNVTWVGQNFSYDCQYFYRFWGAYPQRVRDTMIGHHSLYSSSRKSLDYLSSLYCRDHIYWKDDIKDWDPKLGEKQYWTYNCIDAARTWEIDEALLNEAKKMGLAEC